MTHVQLDGRAIVDWQTFHDQCAVAFGFPEFYGRNMNAWVDCLTYVRDGDGMSRFQLGPDEELVIDVLAAETFKTQAPEVFAALVECTTFVNQRQIAVGELPALRLAMGR